MNGPLTLLLSRLYCLTALIALRLALHFREITGAVNEKCISLCFAAGFNTNGQQAKEMKCVIFWFGSVRKVKCMNSALGTNTVHGLISHAFIMMAQGRDLSWTRARGVMTLNSVASFAHIQMFSCKLTVLWAHSR